MLAGERQQKIMEILKRDGIVYTKDLIQTFSTSRETIRRDLHDLEEQGFLRKVYGGATLGGARQNILAPYEMRVQDNLEDKQEIADAVCKVIREEMAIAMDSSTTNLVICRALNRQFHSLHIITNSIPISKEFRENDGNQLVLLGGNFDKTERCTIGQSTLDQLKNYHVDLYLMSCCGVTLETGITDIGEAELQVKRGMMEVSDKIILVCSHSRFAKATLLKVCDAGAVDCIITDNGVTDEVIAHYAHGNVKILRSCDIKGQVSILP